MKAFLIPLFAVLLALPAFGQSGSVQRLQNQANTIQPKSAVPEPLSAVFGRALIDNQNYVSIDTHINGTWAVPNVGYSTFVLKWVFTKPTAARTLTVPDATGTVLLNTSPPSLAFMGLPIAAGGTTALTAAQSGQTVNLDTASGSVVTLPAPVVGLTYNFQVTVSVTSNAHEIKTSAGTIFVQGVVAQVGSATTFGFKGDGSTHVCLKMNGTTTGGLLGSQFTVTCISATEWQVGGINVASGTAATPFNTTP